jgi:hypothetical protein
MPRSIRLLSAAVVGLAAIALIVMWTSAPAHAQNLLPRHAVCQDVAKTNDARRLQEWMNDRLVEGKMGFVTTANTVCAW